MNKKKTSELLHDLRIEITQYMMLWWKSLTTKKVLEYLEKFILLIAHLVLLKWILFTLKESGTWNTEKVMLHFLGMGVYGGGLIRLTAYLSKRRYLESKKV